jgi:hypothetical protein
MDFRLLGPLEVAEHDRPLALGGVKLRSLLVGPSRRGVAGLAEGAGLMVVGLSERWRQEGLGRVRTALTEAPHVRTVFGRGGSRPGGLAPAESRARPGWSLTGAAA